MTTDFTADELPEGKVLLIKRAPDGHTLACVLDHDAPDDRVLNVFKDLVRLPF